MYLNKAEIEDGPEKPVRGNSNGAAVSDHELASLDPEANIKPASQHWHIRPSPQTLPPNPACTSASDPNWLAADRYSQKLDRVERGPQNQNRDMYPLTPPLQSSPELQFRPSMNNNPPTGPPVQLSPQPIAPPLLQPQPQPPRPPPYKHLLPRSSPPASNDVVAVTKAIEELLSSYPAWVVTAQFKAVLEKGEGKEESVQEVAARIEREVVALKGRAGGRDLVTSLFWRNSL